MEIFQKRKKEKPVPPGNETPANPASSQSQPSDPPKGNPRRTPSGPEQPIPQKKNTSFFARLFCKSSWQYKKPEPPPSEPNGQTLVPNVNNPVDNTSSAQSLQLPLPNPTLDSPRVVEASTTPGGSEFPPYKKDEESFRPATRSGIGSSQKFHSQQPLENPPATTGAVEVDGKSAQQCYELTSAPFGPAQELAALASSSSPPQPSSTSPSPTPRSGIQEAKSLDRMNTLPGTMPRSYNAYVPSEGPRPVGADNGEDARQARTGANAAWSSQQVVTRRPLKSPTDPAINSSQHTNVQRNGSATHANSHYPAPLDGNVRQGWDAYNKQSETSSDNAAKLRKQSQYDEQTDKFNKLHHQLLSAQADNGNLHRSVLNSREECKYQEAEAQRLRENKDNLVVQLREAQDQNRALSGELEAEKSRATDLEKMVYYYRQERDEALQEEQNLKQQYLGQIEEAQKTHLENISDIKAKHVTDMSNLRTEMQSQEHIMKFNHEAETSSLRNQLQSQERDYRLQLQSIEERTRADTANRIVQLEDTVTTLRNKIAEHSSSMHYKPLSDSHFKQSLRDFSQRITNLAASVPRPSNYASAQTLDTTSFLARNSQPRHWGQFVRHITWQIMLQSFFQYPLGFGAFGHEGEGQQEIYQFYRLFAHANPGDPDGGLRLPNDAETNAGRAWLFDGILRDVRTRKPSDGVEKYRRLFWTNVRSVEERLLATLQHMSSNQVEKKTKKQIPSLVSDIGLLSLEMASQRSHIMLEQCTHGDITVSANFKDGDGNPNAAKVVVDLMTQPSMIRIGDGQGELNAKVVLVEGDVVVMNKDWRH